ncbi:MULTISPECIES: DNA translocase FtsK 4TM domain-containing protein [unclassified Psychrobacter]|uniref:DNA translocase FtsK n=1 Tax=unclassified Psychrobacter TaxID=196806 RepID=UPI0025B5F1D0|nr:MULTISPECIES: DNA translocase FtsK 4TM domain-containing protein [unclassified Psychrobacter]MDN3454412.1 DNA translocase FtsK 4TM domain-containing protein [Psychrobacter sp. APC 3350]MDN3502305.1 DNA translocase FtsK 4TM domain-containing protein [Psychrobacter sp. 5A.1]
MISAPLIEYLKKGIFTLLGLILAVYLFVILMTYTGNDPSWSHISSDMTTINNVGGEAGAWLSDLLYSFFGFSAWWLLAFVVYESILIWWDNQPTFWLMRAVAYVFLLLSASALFAQLVALVQQVTNPTSMGLEGVAGGIIGLELQARLAQLLTQWGSVVFLAVFVVITATFAFNIHWMTIYQKIRTLSWFGSGVKRNEAVKAAQPSRALPDDSPIADEQVNQQAEYEQLPLELQSADQASSAQAVNNTGRFGNVLSDFLATSGLADSVKASVIAAKAAAMSSHAKSELSDTDIGTDIEIDTHTHTHTRTPDSTIDNRVHNPTKSLTSNAIAPAARKVEPSFAWNDANTVDDLLASEQMAYSANSMDSSAMPVPNDTQTEASTAASLDKAVFASDAAPTIHSAVIQPAAYHQEILITPPVDKSENRIVESPISTSQAPATPKAFAINENAESVDKLAEAWLAEHADISEHIIETPTQNPKVFHVDTLFEQLMQDELPAFVSEEPVSFANELTHQSSKTPSELPDNDKVVDDDEVAVTSEPPVTQASMGVIPPVSDAPDMTPTNTPPANPKAAPTVEAASPVASMQPITPAKPSVSFAVPEGDSSNHITDMMPDDDSLSDDTNVPVMPHISDDAAFSQKSRSMQTAAYRSSLTPIPEVSILDKPDPDRKPSYTIAELEQLSELLEIKLQEFNVKASVVNAIPGPVVTRFEVELAAGVKASKVTGISRDLARSLSMASLRVVEVIPGKPYIGIEVPNKQREMVRLIELLNTEKFKDPKAQISMAMGKDIGGNPIITDLARAPHMLVAGTTGSGKSVLVNSMLLSMLLKYTPNELRLILIDPKQLELANYNDIPHLLTPVVTDMTEAASALSWCVAEMERRYQLMSLLKVRKLNEFNKKVIAAEKSGNPILDPLWRPNDSVSISQAPKLKTLPMIVIVADEFADMIMQVGKQAEELITRLAQKSRAAGIHLMLATQRPSVDVITGLIKANIPVRAALRVNSKVDSRTILDSGGAEDMLGNGDMLFLGPGQIEPNRVHGAYVSDEEVNRVCDAWRERGAPDYIDNMAGNFELSSPGGGTANASGEDDDLYNDAVAFIMETRKVSASSIQRKFSIGYNRAARIVDSMEEAGLVSSMGKSGKRELLM